MPEDQALATPEHQSHVQAYGAQGALGSSARNMVKAWSMPCPASRLVKMVWNRQTIVDLVRTQERAACGDGQLDIRAGTGTPTDESITRLLTHICAGSQHASVRHAELLDYGDRHG